MPTPSAPGAGRTSRGAGGRRRAAAARAPAARSRRPAAQALALGRRVLGGGDAVRGAARAIGGVPRDVVGGVGRRAPARAQPGGGPALVRMTPGARRRGRSTSASRRTRASRSSRRTARSTSGRASRAGSRCAGPCSAGPSRATASSTTRPATTRAARPGAGRPASGSPRRARAWPGTSSTASTTAPRRSERTVWVDGTPHHVGAAPVRRRPLARRATCAARPSPCGRAASAARVRLRLRAAVRALQRLAALRGEPPGGLGCNGTP